MRQIPGTRKEPSEKLVARIKNSLPCNAIRECLNCNRQQAELLVREGLIPRLVPDRDDRGEVLKNVTGAGSFHSERRQGGRFAFLSIEIDRDPRGGYAASWPIKLGLLGGFRRRFVSREFAAIEFME